MMGQSKTKKIVVNGREVIDRTPAKKLNPYIKAQLLTTLKRDDIVIEMEFPQEGYITYYIKDGTTGKRLFSFDSVWDPAYCSITIGGITVAVADQFTKNGYVTEAQQDVLDVLKAILAKQKELLDIPQIQQGFQRLTPQERVALQVLNTKQK